MRFSRTISNAIAMGIGVILITLAIALGFYDHHGSSTDPPNYPPIYVSIVSHNEEPKPGRVPDFVKGSEIFWDHHGSIVQFANMLHDLGVKYNFQSDWNFLLATKMYDNGTSSTNGKNLLRYLREDLGFEVDPHAHETSHNYADVAYLIEQLGVHASDIVGGFIAHPPNASKLEYFRLPLEAAQYNHTWQAAALWGGGTSQHRNEEMLWVSGIWKPKGNEHFLEHDENAPLPHIGGHKDDWDGLMDLLQRQQSGSLEEGRIHTQTIFVSQGDLVLPGFIEDFREQIEALSEYTESGSIRWVGLGEVLEIWRTEYDAEPNQHPFSVPHPDRDVLLTQVDVNCTYYATFQSHNQKVVQNDNGIFMTYLMDYDDSPPWPGRWRLVRSTDGGSTFESLYTSPQVGSKTACIETDEDNNILAVCSDETDDRRPFLYYRFLASRDYRTPEVFKINHAASGKYSMMYDEDSGKLFLFNHYGKLFIVNATTGKLIRSRQVVEFSGENATTQYPHVFIDGKHLLHHAWTTSHKEQYLYWDIHYINSPNGGNTWHRADGTRLSTPIKPDHSGRADQIILPDEFEYHTWLSNMIVKDGKAHFAYLAQTPNSRQHYVRIDLLTGQIDHRIQPDWGGETISIRGLDGFFVTGPGSSLLYYVGRANNSQIGVIFSDDNGETWHDHAISPTVPNAIYSIGGFREITSDDHIIGSFTSQYGSRGDPYFFKVRVRETAALSSLAFLILPPLLHRPEPQCGGQDAQDRGQGWQGHPESCV